MIFKDKKHFYKINGELLGTLFELQKALQEEKFLNVVAFACNISFQLKDTHFEEIE